MPLAGKVFLAPLNAAFRFFAMAVAALAILSSGTALALTAPKWADLNAQQREILKPLASDWDKLDETRRNKWVVVARRYPTMQPEEQKRLQGRMADWARLTPEQRRVARENFQRTKALPPEQKKAEWQQYQTLPETQKQRLAATVDERKPARQKARQREQEGKVVTPVAPVRNTAPTKPAVPKIKPPAASGPVVAPVTANPPQAPVAISPQTGPAVESAPTALSPPGSRAD
jgi:hypothetical protein